MEVDLLINQYKEIMGDIESEFIKPGQPVIILEGYEYFREVNSLFCRMNNLVEAIFELLSANMAEEACILYRSLLNGEMVIKYLLTNYRDQQKIDEYLVQPIMGRVKFLNNLVKVFDSPWFTDLNKRNGNKIELSKVKEELKELNDILKNKGFEKKKLMSVWSYANSDDLSYGRYLTEYHDLSKAEHSDPSFTQYYRDKVVDDYNTDLVYTLNISKSDVKLKEDIFKMCVNTYSHIFLELIGHISNNESQLSHYYSHKKMGIVALKLANFNKKNISG